EQQVAGLEEVAVFGELLDRIAAIEQNAFVTVDIGDLGLAAAGRGEAGIVGEDAGLVVELGDVDDVRSDRPLVDRKLVVLVSDFELCGFGILAVAGGSFGVRSLGIHVSNPWVTCCACKSGS